MENKISKEIRRIDSLSILLIILGILCLVEVIKPITVYGAVKNWKAVSGHTISVKDVTQGDSLYEGKAPALLVKLEVIAYAYEVDYRTYRGIGYARSKTPFVGEIVKVYYNPIEPQKSTTDSSFDWAYFLTWIVLSVSVFIAEYFWFKLRIKYRLKLLQRIPFRKKKKGKD